MKDKDRLLVFKCGRRKRRVWDRLLEGGRRWFRRWFLLRHCLKRSLARRSRLEPRESRQASSQVLPQITLCALRWSFSRSCAIPEGIPIKRGEQYSRIDRRRVSYTHIRSFFLMKLFKARKQYSLWANKRETCSLCFSQERLSVHMIPRILWDCTKSTPGISTSLHSLVFLMATHLDFFVLRESFTSWA